MARATDANGIQFRMLNKGKGPAVWSPRAQIDKCAYASYMQQLLEETPGLWLLEGTVVDVGVIHGKISELHLLDGGRITCASVVLCSGTFLNGIIHTGTVQQAAGRVGEAAVTGLTDALRRYGVQFLRYKTGTPPRVYRDSVDVSQMEQQDGDTDFFQFHHYDAYARLADHPCWISYTTSDTHCILRENLHIAPLFSGQISSTGPRYCPSVEDKIIRFADKERHQLFLEPESLGSDEYYVNGFSTSMPADVQLAALRTVPGYQQVRFARPGYAIEYDYVPCGQIRHTLQHRRLSNLFLAGQINGTSGYEEAAAQGLIAAINAALYLSDSQSDYFPGREDAYIGVMLDDLVSREHSEPYRMFTSRAEYRLLLRQDNADQRLMPHAIRLGLLQQTVIEEFNRRAILTTNLLDQLLSWRILPSSLEGQPSSGDDLIPVSRFLLRPDSSLQAVLHQKLPAWESIYPIDLIHRIETDLKYAGYIDRQRRAIDLQRKATDLRLPEDLDYMAISTISYEGRERMSRVRPSSIAQASRLGGVTPADIAALLIFLKKRQKEAI